MISKDQLFLLPAVFPDPAIGPGSYHCTECARIEGLLGYYPALREKIDVHHIPHARPRAALIALLGEPYQSLPTLVLGSTPPSPTEFVEQSSVTDRWYCTGADAVSAYLASAYGVSAPHP